MKISEWISGLFSLAVIAALLCSFVWLVWSFVWLNTTSEGMEMRSELSPQWKAAEALEKISNQSPTSAP